MMKRICAVVPLALLLAACETAPPVATPAPPTPQPAVVDAPAPEAPVHVPTRDWLLSGEVPDQSLGAHGYLLFNGRPQGGQRARYEQACAAFNASLEPTAESVPDFVVQMPTYWLLALELQSDDCEQMIERYDYFRSGLLLSRTDKLAAAGPVLAAWSFAPDGEEEMLVLDLSLFSDEDLGRAIKLWKSHFGRAPVEWKDGLAVARFRETFRSMIIAYGEDIVAVLGRS